MVEVTELVNFASKLGYYWQKKGSNKPYFYEEIPLSGKRILTLEEMQQLYNTATTYDWIHKKYVPFFITSDGWCPTVHTCKRKTKLCFRNIDVVMEALTNRKLRSCTLIWVKRIKQVIPTTTWMEICRLKKLKSI